MESAQPHIIIVTDAWYPHFSGVLRVTEAIATELKARGTGCTILHPQRFPNISTPGYAEVKMALPIFFDRVVDKLLDTHKDVAIHIMTEGPLGLTMRNYCVTRGLSFTTAFHTHWHIYFKEHFSVPNSITMHYARSFHEPAARIIVPAQSTKAELEKYGFQNEIVVCPNGVDTRIFRPRPKRADVRRPHMLFVGRVSKEKNVEEFLRLSIAGSKRVVGDGPLRDVLQREYPDVEFSGALEGGALAQAYADADVFVFPSLFDNFSLVLLEALASGVPVAAYPTEGQKLLITNEKLGTLDHDLAQAVVSALEHGDSEACVQHVREHYAWDTITERFASMLVVAGTPRYIRHVITDRLLVLPRHFYRFFTHAGYARSLLFGIDKLISRK